MVSSTFVLYCKSLSFCSLSVCFSRFYILVRIVKGYSLWLTVRIVRLLVDQHRVPFPDLDIVLFFHSLFALPCRIFTIFKYFPFPPADEMINHFLHSALHTIRPAERLGAFMCGSEPFDEWFCQKSDGLKLQARFTFSPSDRGFFSISWAVTLSLYIFSDLSISWEGWVKSAYWNVKI